MTMIMEERTPWTKQDIIPADYIEALECQAMSSQKRDTEWVECNAGMGVWLICRNPCFRCNMIDGTELDILQNPDKGATVYYIGRLKRTTNWAEMNVKQRIGEIATFLVQNRQERSNLRRTGAVIMKMGEAKEAIEERLHFGPHYMDSPRTKSDKNFRMSAVR
eukprot:16440906-Heterocapsa_arctica.AAC.1